MISDRGDIVVVILGLPHLVLADIGDDDRVTPLRGAPEIVDDMRGVEVTIVGKNLNVADRRLAFVAGDALLPRFPAVRGNGRQQLLERPAEVTDQWDIDTDVLVDFRGIDVEVDFARVRRVAAQIAGDAIIEAHAAGDEQIGLLNRHVHPRFAVHAHHSEVQGVRGREAADPE